MVYQYCISLNQIWIQKIAGCNSMTCRKCKTNFDYLSGKARGCITPRRPHHPARARAAAAGVCCHRYSCRECGKCRLCTKYGMGQYMNLKMSCVSLSVVNSQFKETNLGQVSFSTGRQSVSRTPGE